MQFYILVSTSEHRKLNQSWQTQILSLLVSAHMLLCCLFNGFYESHIYSSWKEARKSKRKEENEVPQIGLDGWVTSPPSTPLSLWELSLNVGDSAWARLKQRQCRWLSNIRPLGSTHIYWALTTFQVLGGVFSQTSFVSSSQEALGLQEVNCLRHGYTATMRRFQVGLTTKALTVP